MEVTYITKSNCQVSQDSRQTLEILGVTQEIIYCINNVLTGYIFKSVSRIYKRANLVNCTAKCCIKWQNTTQTRDRNSGIFLTCSFSRNSKLDAIL